MSFVKYQNTNNASSLLIADITASQTTILITDWDQWLFPSSFPFLLTIEHLDASENVILREIVKVVSSNQNSFTVERSAWICVQDDTATNRVQDNTAHAFYSWDKISLYWTAEQVQDIQNNLEQKANQEAIANLYDNTATYSVWDIVVYGWDRYICSTAVETAEDFDSTKWTKVNIQYDLNDKQSQIDTINETISTLWAPPQVDVFVLWWGWGWGRWYWAYQPWWWGWAWWLKVVLWTIVKSWVWIPIVIWTWWTWSAPWTTWWQNWWNSKFWHIVALWWWGWWAWWNSWACNCWNFWWNWWGWGWWNSMFFGWKNYYPWGWADFWWHPWMTWACCTWWWGWWAWWIILTEDAYCDCILNAYLRWYWWYWIETCFWWTLRCLWWGWNWWWRMTNELVSGNKDCVIAQLIWICYWWWKWWTNCNCCWSSWTANTWWWWGWAWWCNCRWWNGWSWLVIVRYPTDCSYWVKTATWGTITTATIDWIEYKVHTFTSNWTFKITETA